MHDSVYIRPAGISDWSRRYGLTVMDHSPYSPDLAPSDFHLFGPLKKLLVGKRFPSDVNVKLSPPSQALDSNFFYIGITSLAAMVGQILYCR